MLSHVEVTSFGAISTSGMNRISNISYSGLVVEDEVVQNVINTVEHKVCLCEASAIAELVGFLFRNIQISTLVQPIRRLAAAVYLKICPNMEFKVYQRKISSTDRSDIMLSVT